MVMVIWLRSLYLCEWDPNYFLLFLLIIYQKQFSGNGKVFVGDWILERFVYVRYMKTFI